MNVTTANNNLNKIRRFTKEFDFSAFMSHAGTRCFVTTTQYCSISTVVQKGWQTHYFRQLAALINYNFESRASFLFLLIQQTSPSEKACRTSQYLGNIKSPPSLFCSLHSCAYLILRFWFLLYFLPYIFTKFPYSTCPFILVLLWICMYIFPFCLHFEVARYICKENYFTAPGFPIYSTCHGWPR